MKSRNVKDYQDIGLNADWCISTYAMGNDYFIFDNEDDTFSLCHVEPEPDGSYSGCEDIYTVYVEHGTFAECVKYFEKELMK